MSQLVLCVVQQQRTLRPRAHRVLAIHSPCSPQYRAYQLCFCSAGMSIISRATTLIREYVPQERGQRVSVGLEGTQEDEFVLIAAYS